MEMKLLRKHKNRKRVLFSDPRGFLYIPLVLPGTPVVCDLVSSLGRINEYSINFQCLNFADCLLNTSSKIRELALRLRAGRPITGRSGNREACVVVCFQDRCEQEVVNLGVGETGRSNVECKTGLDVAGVGGSGGER